ncbi:MAG: transcription-repair coupling factor [Candidatus Accumulibacter sp.]|jgi:transcription-repair coupling factor (superfamily II helicase)|nr:transcription-repair coupling factor [Accumulibacter sp.]
MPFSVPSLDSNTPVDFLSGSPFSLKTPAPGKRLRLPPCSGSGDALCVAQLARAQKKFFAVLTADPSDAQRLLEEIPWFAPDLRVRLLPDWETLPYDNFSPHRDLVSERLATLYSVMSGECDILLASVSTAACRLPPPAFLAAGSFFLKKGEKLKTEHLRAQLALAAYTHVSNVVSPNEYSIRGGLIDLFPMGAALPYRIDLFDDEIETIKAFDADSQRTLYPVDEIRLLPAHEFPFDEKGRSRFRQRFRERFEGDPARSALYKDVSNGIPPAGIEYWLPLFFDDTATLFDYLPKATPLCLHNGISASLRSFWLDAKSRYDLLSGDTTRPLLCPEELFLNEEAFFGVITSYPHLELKKENAADSASIVSGVAVDRHAAQPLNGLLAFIEKFSGRLLLLAESPGRRETLAGLFAEYGLKHDQSRDLIGFLSGGSRVSLGVAPLHEGFIHAPDDGARIAFITETELYAGSPRARHGRRSSRRKASLDNWLRDLSELKVGDPVVHEQHGVARYRGLVRMDPGEGEMEFLDLQYANEARLYVPVPNLHLVSRYSGADPDTVPLHVLGARQWEKAKRRAALQARDTAAELLALYARRAARQGYAFQFSPRDYETFADGFGFEETPDQAAAIQAVLEDMKSEKPMDRLVCGDVGFGKTEVALRAAFCAAASGKQVAVLCPTTLLCEQHFQTFSDRFAEWPIRIAELSRFKTPKETTLTLKDLAEGKVDVVIGTHKLLQKSVKFSSLGLVIIDEEHRFGVRQKEVLKTLRTEIDVLALTATPIPRTLGLSLEGLRDFSIIATPPQKRLSIKTFVSGYSDGIIREALLREFKRGGQVYFLHNEVDTIESMRERLARLLPEARIVVGHGQMKERELERVMRDFTQQRANLLLCTTIVETGIDNPHANTIIINRADKFGLAQLHQLRGRVGRSHHQAYAYLLTQGSDGPMSGLTKQARQRLEAIQMMDELGAGFYLAMHDLEIRGAGEILGENQSGEIQEIGFSLYAEMLKRAVAALKNGKEDDLLEPLDIRAEINLHMPALLPDSYAPDIHERLTLYKRLANCETADEIAAMQEELIDRFGDPPPQVWALLESHRLRLLCGPLGITRLDAGETRVTAQFDPEFLKKTPLDPVRIIDLIQKNREYKLSGQDKLSFERQTSTLDERVNAAKSLIKQLMP